MDQISKIMHQVSKMEKERLRNLIVVSGLLLVSLFCVFFYCGYVCYMAIEELGFGDLLLILSEDHEEFFNIVLENLSLFSEFLRLEMIITLLFSLLFIIVVLIKTDFPSLPKRLKETKKY